MSTSLSRREAIAVIATATLVAVMSLASCGSARPAADTDRSRVTGTAGVAFDRRGALNAVAALHAGAWAVGSTSLINPMTITWNGTAWKRTPTPIADKNTSPTGGTLNGVAAVSARDVWAVGTAAYGRTLILHWNVTVWARVASRDPAAALHSVAAASADDVWAVGQFNDRPVIEHWNGAAWVRVPSQTPAGINSTLNGVAATSGTNAWAVGGTTIEAGQTTLIEHWDGRAWRIVPGARLHTGWTLVAVAATSAGDAWAIGSSSRGQVLIEHWNGAAWTLVPSPQPGFARSLNAVAAVSPTDAWTVGNVLDPNHGGLLTLIEHWNGTAWTRVSSPGPGNLVGVSATSASSAWPVGFRSSSGTAVIERWNGMVWR